jgi:hypothetical protein
MKHEVDTPVSDTRLLMHVAVQAARFTVETVGLCMPLMRQGEGYSFYSTDMMDPWQAKMLDNAGVCRQLAELRQAAKLLVRMHLAEMHMVGDKMYIRMLAHVEDYMDIIV